MANKKIDIWKRLDWAAELALPSAQSLLLIQVVREATYEGHAELWLSRIAYRTRLTRTDILRDLKHFEVLGLIKPASTLKGGDVAYRVVHGAPIPAVQLTLDIHAILDRIDHLTGLSDRERLLLTKLVIHCWDWAESTIEATPARIRAIIPTWAITKPRQVRLALERKGILISQDSRSNRARRPQRWRLAFPEVLNSEHSAFPEVLNSEHSAFPEVLNSEHSAFPEVLNSEHFFEDPSLRDKNELRTTTRGGAQDHFKSLFWIALNALEPEAARRLPEFADAEQEGGQPWDIGWAQQLVDDLAEARVDPDCPSPYGRVVSWWRGMIRYMDMTQPPPQKKSNVAKITNDSQSTEMARRQAEVDCRECYDSGRGIGMESDGSAVRLTTCPACGRSAKGGENAATE